MGLKIFVTVLLMKVALAFEWLKGRRMTTLKASFPIKCGDWCPRHDLCNYVLEHLVYQDDEVQLLFQEPMLLPRRSLAIPPINVSAGGIRRDIVVYTMPGSQARVRRFVSPLDSHAGWPGCYINVRRCGGLPMVLMQLKDPLEVISS